MYTYYLMNLTQLSLIKALQIANFLAKTIITILEPDVQLNY